MYFASDNTSAIAPEILAAIGASASGFASSYGSDDLTSTVCDRVREVFEAPEAEVFLMATGTAANSVALATLCPPWGSVFCHRLGHIQVDECNAPEFFTGGAKLVLMEGAHAKVSSAEFERVLGTASPGDLHCPQPAVLSLTQATEDGASYSCDEIAALAGIAHRAGLRVHMDGTRFANVLARQNVSPAQMSWRAGVDVLCLGATKNGAMAVEAVVLFDPSKAWEMGLRRKRAGHLFSKMRFLSAQMLAYFEDDLWLRLARRANDMADRLADGLGRLDGVSVLNPLGANIVFAEITMAHHHRLQAGDVQYKTYPENREPEGPDDAAVKIRLVPSFSTSEEDVDRFLEVLAP